MDDLKEELDALERTLCGQKEPDSLDFRLLRRLTGNFSDDRRIGEGGCAEVYKGELPNGKLIAVKKLKKDYHNIIDEKMFRREVDSMIKVRHENIVRFLGYCSEIKEKAFVMPDGTLVMAEEREKLLCFPYISNGSLDKHLTDELRGFEWHTRHQIIKGICHGLLHLHEEKGIMHMDLKPANILLGDQMVPMITDFGVSRIDGKTQITSAERLFSRGYAAPEYIDTGVRSWKSDIYSLGVIMIELVTGSRALPNTTKVLRRWRHRWNKSSKHTPLLYLQVKKCLELAVRCQEINPVNRPFISYIVRELNKLDSWDGQIRDSSLDKIISSSDDMLGIEPLEFHFTLAHNKKQISWSIELTNDTDYFMAFKISATSLLPFSIQPDKGIAAPRSKCTTSIILSALEMTPLLQNLCKEEFTVQSTKIDGSLTAVDITDDTFNDEGPNSQEKIGDGDKVVDEVNLTVLFNEVLHEEHQRDVANLSAEMGSLVTSSQVRLKKEQEEKEHKKKEKAEAHSYTIIKVARDDDLKEQIGKDIYFDLVDHEKVRNFRIQKQMPFSSFKEEVAKEYGIPVQFQRFWLWAKRQNHTYRPNRPLTPHEETQSVGQLREVSNKAQNAELKLFLEVELGLDLRPLPPPEKAKEDVLLFFKLYNPEKEELCYMGRLFVKALGKPSEILAKLNEMAGFSPDQEIELYEEIKFEPNVMCEIIDKKLTFRSNQLEDGDILCFQKSPRADYDTQVRYPDVPSFLEYVHNRQVVHFRSLEKPKDDDFSLELSKLHTYDDVVERVARQLEMDDPAKIRLTSHNCYSQQPKPQPIKYRGVEHLLDMLIHYNQTSDILYYEVLDIPLPELQFLKTLKVAFHHPTKDEVVIHSIRLPKNSTIADVINDLKTKVELSSPNAELRVLEVFYHKIYKIFPLQEKIENINDQYWTLRAEEIPEEEKNIGPNDRLIHVYHFMKDINQTQQIQNFGDPFFLLLHEGETLAEVKKRIQSKLQVSADEFSKWKFAFISMNRPDYLQDSDVISTRFQRREVYGAWEQYLGMEHTDTAPKRAYTVNQNRHSYEKPVKIYN